MNKPPLLSIVIPSLHGRTENLRLSLARQTFKDWELIVKQGIQPAAKARNMGAFEARGEFIVFLDDDARIERNNILLQIMDALKKIDEKSAVGIRHKISRDATPFQKRLAFESFEEPRYPSVEQIAEVGWNVLGTLCFAVNRKTFLTLGGFDENLISGEDYEFSYRLTKNGGKIFTLWIVFFDIG